MSKMDRFALACGLVPLISGIVVFLFWLVSRWEVLKLVGFFVILTGIACILGGAIALIFSLRQSLTQGYPIKKNLPKWTLITAIFLSNFLAAGAIIVSVLTIESRYTVRIVNQSKQKLSSITITGAGCLIEVPDLPASASTSQHFYVKQDGTLTIKFKTDDSEMEGVIEDYVTNGMGGSAKVTVDENKTILIEHSEK